MNLNELKVGEEAVITNVGGKGALRQHFLDMGIIPGTTVKVTKFAPMGDPMELLIHGYKLTLRKADATNIERNLYLTMQLLEMDTPVVVALNMMDELRENGGSVDINEIESRLGVPVVPISAAKNEGVDELVNHAIHIAHYKELPQKQDFRDENDHGGAVHRCLHAVRHLICDHAINADIPLHFAASKVIEGDTLILEKLNLDDNEKEMIDHMVLQMENERGLGDWRICTSLISGFMAKESVVSIIKVLYGSAIKTQISTLSVLSLLVFSLLYTPCVAAVASVKRELGAKWALIVVLWQCGIAWLASFIVYNICGLF